MLKRRILASSMASVMALTSMVSVAFADDAAEIKTQSVKKADLDKYLNTGRIKALVDGKVEEYGTISGQRFTEAVQFAQVVLEDEKSGVNDYTVAYQLVKAEEKRLVQYSAEQLKALVNENKAKYNTENLLNENGDQIYAGDKWDAFADAYEDAEYYMDSTNLRDTTDAYEVLEEAAKMKPLPTVTKTQFAKARAAYEKALEKEFAYQAWQRGTVSGTGTNYDGKNYAWGTLYAHVKSISDGITTQYDKIDAIKTSANAVSSDPAVVAACEQCEKGAAILNGFEKDSVSGTNTGTLLKKYNSRLVYDFAVADATAAYDKLLAAAGVSGTSNTDKLQAWISDGVAAPSWVDVATSGLETPAKLAGAKAWFIEKAEVTYKPDGVDGNAENRMSSATLKLRNTTGSSIFFLMDNSKKTYAGKGSIDVTTVDPSTTKGDFDSDLASNNDLALYEWKNGTTLELSDYIALPATLTSKAWSAKGDTATTKNAKINNVIDEDKADPGFDGQLSITGVEWTVDTGAYTDAKSVSKKTVVDLADAYAAVLAADALKADKNNGTKLTAYQTAYQAIDELGEVPEDKQAASSKELSVIYKYLFYALADKYDADLGNAKKLVDVNELIEKSYTLAEKTVETSLFNPAHMALYNERNYAVEWRKLIRATNPYKENVTGAMYNVTDNTVANDAYTNLSGKYDQLNSEYEAFGLSFGDIYNEIAMVSVAIDNGVIDGTDDIIKALEETALALNRVKNVVDTSGNELTDNEPFTADRAFNPTNRVYTNDGDFDGLLLSDGSKFHVAKALEGDNQTHYDLKTAYNKLQDLYEKALSGETGILGDVDGNGIVDVKDVSKMLTAMAKGEENTLPAVADFNRDDKINVKDVSEMLTFILKG